MGLQQDPAAGIAHLVNQDLCMGRDASEPRRPSRALALPDFDDCERQEPLGGLLRGGARGLVAFLADDKVGAGRRYAPRQGDGCGDAEPQPPLQAEGGSSASQPVVHAAHDLDDLVADLLAEPADMNLDGVALHLVAHALPPVLDLGLGDHRPGLPQEHL